MVGDSLNPYDSENVELKKKKFAQKAYCKVWKMFDAIV